MNFSVNGIITIKIGEMFFGLGGEGVKKLINHIL